MCGVIGVYIHGKEKISTIEKIFSESRIRGMHATGLSYHKDGQLHTIIETVSADQFIKNVDFSEMYDGEVLKLIGHCRYSTSDLEYNQPLFTKDLSIVHNGVITQESPELWSTMYDIECETKNDSELLMRTFSKEPMKLWGDASISSISLSSSGSMSWMRNGKRPMAIFCDKIDNIFLTSTIDIGVRSGLVNGIKVEPFYLNTISESGYKTEPQGRGEDWQMR